jgi:Fe-S cluster biogenesis protein NfuA
VPELPQPVVETLRDIVAPLVAADGGALYAMAFGDGIRVHLAGACAGCPGTRVTGREIIEPALRAAGMRGDIEITAGWTIPEGAQRIGAPLVVDVDDDEIEPLSSELYSQRPPRSEDRGGTSK